MLHRTVGLRRFLTRTALGGLVLAGLPAVGAAAAPQAPAATPPRASVAPRPAVTPVPLPTIVHVRKEISTFTSAQVDAYRKGVALMQSRAFNDPTSWIYQANMHGYPTNNTICPVIGTPQEAWSTCQHGNFFFLAWHRMYLYYFERILRAAVRQAISNPTYEFNLPFWNYEDPNLRTLPKPFRDPANTTNSLYVQKRRASCNAGQQCISASDASDTDAMGLIPFCVGPGGTTGAGCTTSVSSDETFGGGYVSAPTHSGNGPGELELQPHGVVHNAVGGPGGWMSYFICAARDPIFWLHHANIDRLWQKWLNQGGNRKNPIANGEWTKQTFVFFDENKKKVTMTGCQILNMATQLNYKYDGVAVTNIQLCPTTPVAAPAPTAIPETAASVEVAGTPAGETRLRDAPVSVDVALPARTESTGPAKKTRIQVEGVKVLTPGAIYQVYLNLPEGQKPDPKGPYFLGNISIFADPEHTGEVTRTFDVTSRAKALWKGRKVHLTFVKEKIGTAVEPEATQDFISFKRVSIRER
jgi:tyrosinase